MADINERIECLACRRCKGDKFKLSKRDLKIVDKMFGHFKESELLRADFHGVDYSGYGHDSNAKRLALLDSINENYQVIWTCFNKLCGNILDNEYAMTDGSVTTTFEDIEKKITMTCNAPSEFGIDRELSESLDIYQKLLAGFLIKCYVVFQLFGEEFYQDLLKLMDSKGE